jgi:hypothetical protein
VPPHLAGLVDDAPEPDRGGRGSGGLGPAVAAHLEHLGSAHADLVGALVVPDRLLPALPPTGKDPTPGRAPVLRVRVSGGAGALAPAVAWAGRTGLPLRGLDLAMRESDAGDLAPNARRIVAAVDDLLATGEIGEATEVCVEPPALHGQEPTVSWLDALDVLAAAEHRMLVGTGDVTGDAGPTPAAEVATCIRAALDREMPLAAGGPGRAVARGRAGGLHHGFLNLLVAARADLDGADAAEVVRVLEETDPAALLGTTDAAALASARQWFTSFRCGSVVDACTDLVQLGLLEAR